MFNNHSKLQWPLKDTLWTIKLSCSAIKKCAVYPLPCHIIVIRVLIMWWPFAVTICWFPQKVNEGSRGKFANYYGLLKWLSLVSGGWLKDLLTERRWIPLSGWRNGAHILKIQPLFLRPTRAVLFNALRRDKLLLESGETLLRSSRSKLQS